MTTCRPCRTLIALLLAGPLYLPHTGLAAPARKSVGAWSAVCATGARNYCTASTRVKTQNAPPPYRFQLNVSRASPEHGFEIALLTAREHPGPDSTIVVQVDNGDSQTLEPGQGYRKAGRTNTYIVAEYRTEALLAQMRKGGQVSFVFQDAQGKSVTAVFSLSGLVGVLAFADQMQPQPKAAVPPRVANAPSGEESPPRAQAAPAQQAGAPPSAKPVPAQGAGDAPAAKPAPATAPVSRKRGARSVRQFSCRGQEPFWTLRIDNDTARYVTLTDGGSKEPMTLSGKLSITGEGATPVTDWRGKSDWGARYRAVISEERCVDTMSDAEGNTEFAYRVALTLPDGKTVSGCCAEGLDAARATRTPGAAEKIVDTTQYPVADLSSKPETQWTHHLSDFLLAIQACIDATPEPDPYATKAWPINRGMVGVRTRNRDGGWFECISDTQGREVEHIGRLPPGTKPAPNEDYAIFSPPDQPPPAGNCYRHERVMDGMGDFRGWLSTHNC